MDAVYKPNQDIEINLFDPTLNIIWPKPFNSYIISEKDRNNKRFEEIKELLENSVIKTPTSNNDELYLVYGSNGFLGSLLLKELIKLNKSFRVSKARLENRNDLLDEIKTISPTRILCLAGIAGKPNISWCDKNQIETIRVNLIGQLNIADIANELNLHCTLLTSGAIYKYDESHSINSGNGFTEDERPNFDGNFYSNTRIIEEELLKSYTNVLSLRISYPTNGTLNPNSLISKLIRFSKIQSIPLSISVTDDLWPIMIDMSNKKIVGTFNFNNPGSISHDDILKLYKEIVNPNHQWELIEPDTNSRAAAELSANKLSNLGYNIPNIKDSLRTCMVKIKDQKETISS